MDHKRRARRHNGCRLLVASAAVLALAACGKAPKVVPAPPSVTVAKPVVQRVADYLDFTGNTASAKSVTVVARVEGYLEQIHFADGAKVKKGDLLFTIQQDQYKAQLQQAQAQLQAQKVALKHAETELGRYSQLVQQDAATETMVDHWQAQKDSATAALLGAEAQVTLAALNLSYTEVRAPFDGRIGRHLVDVGTLVGTMGQPTSLAEIQQIDPIYVYFTIDERDLLRVMDRYKAETMPIARGNVPVSFGLLTEDGYTHEGRLDFAAVSVAPTTGTLQVRGIFPNADLSVLPGLFVRVRVAALQTHNAQLVPGDAVSFDQQGEYVLVVNTNNIVERRGVKVGKQVGEMLAIEDGLTPNDAVVVDGMLQAIPGRVVNAHERSAATADGTPRPSGG